jgi:hypothetical protein
VARRWLFLLTLVFLGLRAPSAQAYPWLIKHGFAQCGNCHVDPMGGETLRGMGRAAGESLLAMPWGQATPSSFGQLLFGVPESESVHVGGSVRGMMIGNLETAKARAFPMQLDLTAGFDLGDFTLAGSVGVSRASRRYEHASKARVLGNVDEEGVLLVSRNYWLGYHIDDAWMVRLGRLNLPFGLRIPEHTQWVRSQTFTDRESDQQHGVSVVYAAGRWRGELMASLGNYQRPNDALRERGYVGHLEYLIDLDWAVGVSSMALTSERELNVDDGRVVRQAHGLTARYVFSQPFVLLAEADVLSKTGSGLGYVGLATLDYEPTQGLHLALTGQVLDRGKSELGAGLGRGEAQYESWLTADWFFAPHFELRTDLVLRGGDRGQLIQLQLHMYL